MNAKHTPGARFEPPTVVDLLRQLAAHQPDLLAYLFLEDGEAPTAELTFAELDRQARAVAALLQAHAAPGERALLLYLPGLQFIAAYFGCLYAGVIAVPVYPPRLNRPSQRIRAVVRDAGASVALTTSQIYEGLSRRFEHMPELASLIWLDTGALSEGLESSWQPTAVTPDTLAFLQYTSGSTGSPKGVMVSHGNLIHNLAVINQGFRIPGNDIGVHWLPNYHDMGLIGGILEPLYAGGPSILMPPAAFLQRPIRWLETITRYGGTISGAPNFAYQMCIDKSTPEQRARLDLSTWGIAYCGAEPVRRETLDAFAKAFAPCGFNPAAFYPCYGMAEATLIITGGDGPSRLQSRHFLSDRLKQHQAVAVDPTAVDATIPTQELVSCGHTHLDQRLVIANPDTLASCPPGEVGEIWLQGDSVAQGYWGRPEQTAATFEATLSDTGEGPFLRTGDLGFLYDGDLYVTGRLKDLIIIRGRNLYPQDIEFTAAQSHVALEQGMGAAFSVDVDGEEKLVLVNELARRHRKADIDEVATAVRRAIATEHQVQLHALVLIKPLSVPKTSSGKVKRHACKEDYLNGTLKVVGEWAATDTQGATRLPAAATPADKPADPHRSFDAGRSPDAVAAWLQDRIAVQLKQPPGSIDPRRPFVDYGLDSVQALALTGDLEAWLGQDLPPTLVWDYPTIEALANHLGSAAPAPILQPQVTRSRTDDPIAIVGIGCHFPGADGPDAFWELLRNGVDAISEVPAARWDADHYHTPGDQPEPGKMSTRWGGFLTQVDQFDADFFGISPREAARMDPQQRLLLETAWEALEHAGQNPTSLRGSQTAVFVGISSYDYSRLQFSHPDLIDAYAGTGNAHSVAANRLSYSLDLRGPSMAIDTACSSSLVAVHMALQSLRSGEADLALAGGVNLLLLPELTITFSQARMMAPDGRCKTFDATADGYVRGEGCGMVVLKRLSDAERDGDTILGLVRGSAVNQDGRSNGLTAPNGRAQQAVIQQALASAGITPDAVSYVEAHGTGTSLGDPIEIRALQAVFDAAAAGAEPPALPVGSVKTNIGHLEAAAGIAGLIKVVLAMQHGAIPPHLHFSELNPHIDLIGSRLVIGAAPRPWPATDRPRIAGVSSFGFGGTNAHVVVEEAPRPITPAAAPTAEPAHHLLTLSARTPQALHDLATRYAGFLASHPAADPADVAYSARAGRADFDYRLAIVATSTADMQQQLHDWASFAPAEQPPTPGLSGKIAFLFTGQGAQYPGMAAALYQTSAIFRAALDRCAALLNPALDRPLLDVIFGGSTAVGPSSATHPLDATQFTQPALFAVEYALAELWRAWGFEPDIVIGHSIGELTAAAVAGVFTLEDACRLVAARARLMGSLPAGGAMAAVFTDEIDFAEVATAVLDARADVTLAAVNGPQQVVIAGSEEGVTAVVTQLAAHAIETRRLTVSHAFHSPLMDPILDAFEQVAAQITCHAPRVPLVSNLTGDLLTTAPDAAYWRDHIRRPVRFAAGVQTLAAAGVTTFIEIGPQPHLIGMARRVLPDTPALWLPSLRESRPDWETLLDSLGRLYTAGATLPPIHPGRKIQLPTYPFQRRRHWLDVHPAPAQPAFQPGSAITQLDTVLPIFEQHIRLAGEDTLRAHATAVANAFWGGGTHQITGLLLNGPLPDAPTRLQTTLTATSGDNALFQTFRRHDDSWLLIASGQLARGVAQENPPQHEREDQADQESLDTILRRHTAAVLGLPPERLRVDQPLDTVGLDSLMALELKNHIERELGIDLPVVALLQGPTLAQLADQLAERAAQPTTGAIQPITNPFEPQPLSANQRAMWMLHQLLPDDVSFNVAGAVRVRGPLDLDALQTAVQQLVTRHPALRTIFRLDGAEPVQMVLPSLKVALRFYEPGAWDAGTLRHEAHRPFDLTRGPLLRMVVARHATGDHTLLLAVNHIVADFWSMGLLVAELYQLYTAVLTDTDPALPALQLTAADVAAWQAQQLAGEQGTRLRDYWHQQLAGELPRLNLPTDRPRPAVQTFAGHTVRATFDAALAQRLHAFSNAHGATLATTLLAAFQILLHRYTGQDDLLVGSVVAGRERPELQPLAGYFVNSVALRARFAGDPAVGDFLTQTRQTLLDAIAHQDYPLPLLAEELAASGSWRPDPSRPPLFETMFIMQRAQSAVPGMDALALGLPGEQVQLGDLALESLPVAGLPSQFDMTLMMAETAGGLAAALHYNSDLFDEATMVRLLDHLDMLLQGMVADPTRPVSAIPLLTPAERRRLLVDWNDTAVDYPRDACLHDLFAQQAARTPDAVAVTFAGSDLTYAELDARSNRLAHSLRQRGIGPESLVGVYVDRSLDMPVALLGVLKAGGAYIPLDPDFPAERISLMLDDATPAVILTQSHLADQLAPAGSVAGGILALDADWPTIAACPATPPPAATRPDNLAYLIYTSGSTGKPKGVQIEHRAAVNFLTSMQREPGLTADDHLLAVTTLSFDIALLELFLPLICGARVTIADRDTAVDGVALQQAIANGGITVMQATPATWRLLIDSGWQGTPQLKVLCGGEALPPDLATQLLPRCRELWNMYGPTETTVWSTTGRIIRADEIISVGRPIANTTVFILDDARQPVPPGMTGHLYIGGDGVARGYYNRPDLTAEKFIAYATAHRQEGEQNPLRLYKTGDLARYLPDGRILFLGRSDFQVKIRGYRIELGDIEAALAQHSQVAQAVVDAREAGHGRHLIAYIIPTGAPPGEAELRAFLRDKLPDYMIPALIVTLERFPLTPNGKINRRALPQPDFAAHATAYVAPRTALEADVAALCADVLGLPRVGIHDSFFDMGGNSLLAARLIFQAREQFQVHIPLRQLFAQPTAAGLARIVETARHEQAGRSGYTNGHGNGRLQDQRNGHGRFPGQPAPDAITLEELRADVVLDPAIAAGTTPHADYVNPRHVLLTGATGFVGAFLLRDLLRQTQATVHCLVRARDAQAGLARLQANLDQYGLWDAAFVERIAAVTGHLDQPRLGLDDRTYSRLTDQIDAVYHNGALVNFIYSYAQHKPANVNSTAEILRLAATTRIKAVHFVSTLSVFHAGQHAPAVTFAEDTDLDQIGVPFGGYAQSKWVGEKLVELAHARGLPVAIYRPGLVSGDSRTGAWNTADMMSTMAQACLAIGAVPDLNVQVDLVPVDYVSSAIVRLSLQESAPGGRFNLANPAPLPYAALLAWAQSQGLPLRAVPFAEWRQMLINLALQFGHDNPFLPLLDEVTADQIFMPQIDCHQALTGLQGSDIRCAPVDARLLDTYLAYYIRSGFVALPRETGS